MGNLRRCIRSPLRAPTDQSAVDGPESTPGRAHDARSDMMVRATINMEEDARAEAGCRASAGVLVLWRDGQLARWEPPRRCKRSGQGSTLAGAERYVPNRTTYPARPLSSGDCSAC
jgi:hypothetical protein